MVGKMLEASTAHITEELDQDLHRRSLTRQALGAHPLDRGWLFTVRENDGDYEEVSLGVWAIIKPLIYKAREEGASFILLDGDAPDATPPEQSLKQIINKL